MFLRACATTFLVLIAASAAHAQYTVTAAWDRNSDAMTAGYRVFYGTTTGSSQWSVDAGNQTSATINLSPGRYYFRVRAYNTAYTYGPPSSEVTFTVGQAPVPVGPTAAIQASLQSPGVALVSWQTTNATSASINGLTVPVSGTTTTPISSTTTFTITARSAAGLTATASATVSINNNPAAAPQPPVNMTASVAGSRVTLSWRPAPTGGTPTEYLLYVGSYSWGTNIVRARSVGNVLTVSADLPPGSYYARVRARNAAGISRSSTQVFFRVGRQLATPTGFTANWQGTRLSLNWVASAADSADAVPSDYVLEAGSGPGLADIAAIPLGSATSFSADVPTGVYFVRVRAANDRGDSNPTNEIVIAAPGSAAAPRGLTAGGNGSTVELNWSPPAGAPVAGYVIEAGSDPGLSDIVTVPVGNVTRFVTEAPPGTYFVRVRAINAKGPGLPSNEVVVQK